MKKIFDEALAAARAKPMRFASIVLLTVVALGIALALGESAGHELYRLTH